MKSIIICGLLLIFSTISFSQQTKPAEATTKQHFLRKSKQQRTTGWILAGGGVVLEVAGAIAYQYGNASLILFGAGLLAQIVSIPFFITAAINDHKAKKASLSFKLEKTPRMQPAVVGSRPNLQLALKIPL